jgi:hypothetical protein
MSKDISQGGPVQWGRITRGFDFSKLYEFLKSLQPGARCQRSTAWTRYRSTILQNPNPTTESTRREILEKLSAATATGSWLGSRLSLSFAKSDDIASPRFFSDRQNEIVTKWGCAS